MSKTFNMFANGGVEAPLLAIQATNGFPTSVTATNGTKTVNLTLNGELPSGYTQLEYIECTGTQYINTGVQSNNDNVLTGSYTNTVAAASSVVDKYVFGIYTYASGQAYSRTQLSVAYDGVIGWGGSFIRQTNENVGGPFSFHVSKTGFIVGGQNIYTPQVDNFTNPGNIFLLAVNSYNGGVSMPVGFGTGIRIHSFAISRNGTQLIDLTPARRNSDGEIGMYDSVSGTLFTNAGTGTFVAGPTLWTGNVTPGTWTVTATDGTNSGSISVTVDDVKVYSRIVGMSELGGDYTKLQYIDIRGAIDTGVYPVSANRIIAKLQFPYGWPSSIQLSICMTAGTSVVIGGFVNRISFNMYGGTWNNWTRITNADGILGSTRHTYNFRYGTCIVDTTTYSYSYVTITTNTDSPLVIQGIDSTTLRVFFCQVKNTSDTDFIANMIPAIRNSDGVVGLCDTAREIFIAANPNYTIAGPAA